MLLPIFGGQTLIGIVFNEVLDPLERLLVGEVRPGSVRVVARQGPPDEAAPPRPRAGTGARRRCGMADPRAAGHLRRDARRRPAPRARRRRGAPARWHDGAGGARRRAAPRRGQGQCRPRRPGRLLARPGPDDLGCASRRLAARDARVPRCGCATTPRPPRASRRRAGCSPRTVELIRWQDAPRDPEAGERLRLADEAS